MPKRFGRAVEQLHLVMAEVQMATVRNQVLLSMGFNESTGVVSLDSGKLTRCQIQNPETRPRNLTGRWQEGLRVTTEMQNAELRPEI